ncbi:tetratricopeptide repeat protein [Simiduia agarivorans]|uniref:Serine/threonine protein kinase n=1 Tax=Simiduia agarivorans (strain DSM 21679 / JCM 13881 / BCRC 17597 / SA1) TaxID=1117647 RepID=K4KMX7_SIMAS|nr:tetratricopeptide repeat protein [Simiduia agarivorans]AFU99575.1 serine/threonine protein kinase [Simiduia agarivorans SA1 = DSM 21679]
MQVSNTHSDSWRMGELLLHASPPELLRNGQPVSLDRSSLLVLLALVTAHGEPVTKEQLLLEGWPNRVVHENSLAKAISRLRTALKPDAVDIKAVHGFGYRLEAAALERMATEPRQPPVPAGMPVRPVRKKSFAVLIAAVVCLCLSAIAAGTYYWQEYTDNAQADALLQFLAEDLLVSVDPYAAPANLEKQNEMRFMVERIVTTMDTRFAGEPNVLMTLHHAVARAFSGWGEYDKAVSHLQQAKRLAEAQALRAETIALEASLCNHLRLAGKTHAAEQACDIAVTNAARVDAPGLSAVRVERAKLLFEIGRYQAAVDELMMVLVSAGPATDQHIIADAHWFLGLSLRKLARFDDADAAFKALLESRQQLHPSNHPLIAWAYTDYGDFLVHVGRFEQANTLLGRAQEIFTVTLGPEHVESVSPAYSLGVMYNETQRWADAISTLNTVLAVYQQGLGADHLWTLYTLGELALAYAGAGDTEKARALLAQSRTIGERQLYGRPSKSAHFHMRWAQALLQMQDYAGADAELALARQALRDGFPTDHPLHATGYCLAANLSLAQGDRSGARLLTNRCAQQMGALNMPASFPLNAQLASLNRALAEG